MNAEYAKLATFGFFLLVVDGCKPEGLNKNANDALEVALAVGEIVLSLLLYWVLRNVLAARPTLELTWKEGNEVYPQGRPLIVMPESGRLIVHLACRSSRSSVVTWLARRHFGSHATELKVELFPQGLMDLSRQYCNYNLEIQGSTFIIEFPDGLRVGANAILEIGLLVPTPPGSTISMDIETSWQKKGGGRSWAHRLTAVSSNLQGLNLRGS